MGPQHTVKAIVRKGERQYVAECVELAGVTKGETVDETLANLREAVALHLEGEDPATFGLAPNPTIVVTMELEPGIALAEDSGQRKRGAAVINGEVDFVSEHARILQEVEALASSGDVGGNITGRSWGKFKGDVVCRIIAHHVEAHLPVGCKVVGPNVYVHGLPFEFDLMLVDRKARPRQFTNAFEMAQVRCVLEVKQHGIYGKRERLEEVLKKQIGDKFHAVVDRDPRIKPLYLAVQETIEPVKAGSIRYADRTRETLQPYGVYILMDSRGRRINKGEWQRFVADVIASIPNEHVERQGL